MWTLSISATVATLLVVTRWPAICRRVVSMQATDDARRLTASWSR